MNVVINDRFSISRDEHGWTLTDNPLKLRKSDHPEGKWKKGDSYRRSHQTYYGNLYHLCCTVLDKSAGDDCVVIPIDIKKAIWEAEASLKAAIEQVGAK